MGYFLDALGCDQPFRTQSAIKPLCMENDCHNNVLKYIWNYGGEHILGYHFVEFSTGKFGAILHSIVKTVAGDLLDITPPMRNRLFAPLKNPKDILEYPPLVIVDPNTKEIEFFEREQQYAVYALCDPRKPYLGNDYHLGVSFTFEPFYIGKGRLGRPVAHFQEAYKNGPASHPKCAKILSIEAQGLKVEVQYLKFFIDESSAYQFESDMISQIGSKYLLKFGIKDGPLTNLCPDNRPPNQKGRTYEEIMGKERAEALKTQKNEAQRAAGGYGPKQHSEETKRKISNTEFKNYRRTLMERHMLVSNIEDETTLDRIARNNPYRYPGSLIHKLYQAQLIDDYWRDRLKEKFKEIGSKNKGKSQSDSHKTLRLFNSGRARFMQSLGISHANECTQILIDSKLSNMANWEKKKFLQKTVKYGLTDVHGIIMEERNVANYHKKQKLRAIKSGQ